LIINVGNKYIGNSYIPLQTMIKNPVTDIDKTISKIDMLHKEGCDIIRISIPDNESVTALKKVLESSPIPVVADIHFDYKLAIASIEAGVHKVRINPGNIGSKDKIKSVIDALKYHKTPVRIGINGGSINKEALDESKGDRIEAMIRSAQYEIKLFEDNNYSNIVLSFKSSSVIETIAVNTKAKKLFGYPLHIGVTEAGDLIDGTIKNSCGISHLLLSGIGDTIRVSLTDTELEEIKVGKRILEACGKREPDFEIVSCPTCGRTSGEIVSIVKHLKNSIDAHSLKKKLKIAVMGCIVNGPGEAKECDFGVACGKDNSIIFKNGNKIKTVKNIHIIDELLLLAGEYNET